VIPDITLYDDVSLYDFIVAIFVLFAAVIVAKALTLNITRVLKNKIDKEHLGVILKIVYYGTLTMAFLFILPLLGIEPSAILVLGGIVGLVIGFASQTVVGNLISGIFLIVERPVKIGEQVNIDGVSGYVEDISIISTQIRTYDGLYIRIPNEKVFTANITNYVGGLVRRFEYEIGIRYSDDAEKAISLIKELIERHPFVLKNPSPLLFVESLGDNSVNIVVKIWTPVSEWYSVKTELLWKIKKTLEENGIEIPFPQRVVWFGNV